MRITIALLIVAGLVILLAWMSERRRDRDLNEEWDKILGK